MFRRQFIAGVAAILIAGCNAQRPKGDTPTPVEPMPDVPPRPTATEWEICTDEESEFAGFLRSRIEPHLPMPRDREAKKFAILTILSLIGFVVRVIQGCQAASVAAQHAAIQAKPRGAVAKHLKRHLHAKMVEEHPDMDAAELSDHVDAALKAYGTATPEEIADVKAKADGFNKQPLPDSLIDFTKELSRRDL